jgi:predicted aldo/keto reductase-like oxidoreductase
MDVSILSLGGMFDIARNHLMLKQALEWGLTYWDTADCYRYGIGSEKGFGKFFNRYPESRERVFLVTKSDRRSPKGMSKLLDRSLDRLQTDYIDLYFIHAVRSIDELDDDTRDWAEKRKAEGKIRLFGFSTHSNMEDCLLAAAKLGWIDGIMMTYNFRLMHTERMRQAVDACTAAGIGLTAMKTQGGGQVKTDSDTELELAGRFVKRGFTDAQAKLKAVWENPQIASICSQMPNMSLLMSNIAAATDRVSLSKNETDLMQAYAQETAFAYCAGCVNLCESALEAALPVGDVMRALMYCRSYGDRDRAREVFAQIPDGARRQIANIDFTAAERRCPQKLAIGRLMREAVEELA